MSGRFRAMEALFAILGAAFRVQVTARYEFYCNDISMGLRLNSRTSAPAQIGAQVSRPGLRFQPLEEHGVCRGE